MMSTGTSTGLPNGSMILDSKDLSRKEEMNVLPRDQIPSFEASRTRAVSRKTTSEYGTSLFERVLCTCGISARRGHRPAFWMNSSFRKGIYTCIYFCECIPSSKDKRRPINCQYANTTTCSSFCRGTKCQVSPHWTLARLVTLVYSVLEFDAHGS